MTADVSIVMATRDRVDRVAGTLAHLLALPDQPPVIVVDNGSQDGTAERVRRDFPSVRVLALATNRGAVARTVGVEAAGTPYVAFADDDSWWAPGALGLAAACFDPCDRLAVVAARILVGPEERLDPVCQAMASSPLPPVPGLPGPPILGFVACGAVVRRSAYLDVGGFDPLLFFLGEEDALALDLASRGWHLAYVPEVVAHHHPAGGGRQVMARRRLQARNALLTAWTRRSPRTALQATARAGRAATRDPAHRGALLDATRRLPAVVRQRRPVPTEVERWRRMLDAAG